VRTSEIARRLNVSPNTVRNWTRDYQEFFSESITDRGAGARRRFANRDALVMATIADFRNKGLTKEQIIIALKEDRLLEQLPTLPTEEEEIQRIIEERDKAHISREEANQKIQQLQHEQ